MAKKSEKPGGKATVVIRREEVIEGGHHGGAWKVAYADFVTAMMAFFLLMWLLNATSEDQKRGLADYFATAGTMTRAMSGSGAPFGGKTPFDNGSLVSDRGSIAVVKGKADPAQPPDDPEDATEPPKSRRAPETEDGKPVSAVEFAVALTPDQVAAHAKEHDFDNPEAAKAREGDAKARDQRERQAFQQAAEQIRDAVRADPALADLARQLAIDQTPDGLRIQLLDEDRTAMFATGSAVPNDRARQLLQKIGPILGRLSERIAIAGHTDAAPYRGTDRSNWELSADRANATRRLLAEAGIPEARIQGVTGVADRDPLLPADPLASANRRIAITVLRAAGLKP